MSTPLRQNPAAVEGVSLGLAAPGASDAPLANNATKKHSQTIMVEIKGCLSGFHMIGPEAATWRPVEGRHAQIFGVDTSNDHGNMAAEVGGDGHQGVVEAVSAANTLRNVNITKATVLQSHNTFDIPLGVTINCLPRTEAVDTGDKYTFTTIPKASVNVPQTIYEAGETQTAATAWRASFPAFNYKNLETQGVLTLQNCPYVFVNENHPVINLLRVNKGVLGVDINEVPKMDGEWYKLATPLMSSCCDTIRSKILSKFRTSDTDLGQLCIQLHRLGDVPWNHTDKADVLRSFQADPSWSPEKLKVSQFVLACYCEIVCCGFKPDTPFLGRAQGPRGQVSAGSRHLYGQDPAGVRDPGVKQKVASYAIVFEMIRVYKHPHNRFSHPS